MNPHYSPPELSTDYCPPDCAACSTPPDKQKWDNMDDLFEDDLISGGGWSMSDTERFNGSDGSEKDFVTVNLTGQVPMADLFNQFGGLGKDDYLGFQAPFEVHVVQNHYDFGSGKKKEIDVAEVITIRPYYTGSKIWTPVRGEFKCEEKPEDVLYLMYKAFNDWMDAQYVKLQICRKAVADPSFHGDYR
jgi:hypothetical protein